MLLSVAERINLMQILPREGGFLTMKIVRALGEAIDFDEEERKRIKLVEVEVEGGKNLKWDVKAEDVDIENIDTATQEVVAKVLTDLNNEKKLTPALVTLYQKFVGEPATT